MTVNVMINIQINGKYETSLPQPIGSDISDDDAKQKALENASIIWLLKDSVVSDVIVTTSSYEKEYRGEIMTFKDVTVNILVPNYIPPVPVITEPTE